MKSTPDIFYLNFGSLNIKIIFEKARSNGLKEAYKHNILSYYKPFILTGRINKVVCQISFQDTQIISRLNLKEKQYLLYVNKISQKKFVTYYHISLAQFQLIIDEILTGLNQENCFRLHASCSTKNGKALIFMAPSGGGKSTIVQLLAPDFTPFSDDSLFVLKDNNKYFCIKNLTLEKNPYSTSIKKYPIQAFFFLKKSPSFSIRSLKDSATTLEQLSKQVWIKNKNTGNNFMSKFMEIFKNNQFYQLSFAKDRQGLINFLKKNLQ